ncbi:ATP-binding protein [Litoribacter alkaliphilus]|uniref:ATP-binding protein n=1 Tax=Litoribacter ruber TaxID=702568 RepID=A0AAP2CKS0_9BACT|nr:DNA/RNA helicase domain-containing protein [Litoribacter alkaliphilus]MBS9525977.1 ATP-binding protein [Litoribacter alkaliphilus]
MHRKEIVNIKSIVQSYSDLSEEIRGKYFLYKGFSPKPNELEDLKKLVAKMNLARFEDVFDGFYFGYTIPQISKEFDLLRFGNDLIWNVELKRKNINNNVKNQLIRNRYYLSFLKKRIFLFSYVSEEDAFYQLTDENELIEINTNKIFKYLLLQNFVDMGDLNSLFNPTSYMVSPFNSTNKFIEGQYFLTSQQEQIKKDCIELINKKKNDFFSISGGPGSGKTLLIYDLVKFFRDEGRNVLIVHCGTLNKGHYTLNSEYGWNVLPIKGLNENLLVNFDVILVDETQRIFPQQLEILSDHVRGNNKVCIFSYDKEQCLRDWEVKNDIPKVVDEGLLAVSFRLGKKIRMNKELIFFTEGLFDKSKSYNFFINHDNVLIKYFNNTASINNYLQLCLDFGWKVINFTPSAYYRYPYDKFEIIGADTAHSVIGQEFDDVVAVIDDTFYYNKENKLVVNYSPYYNQSKMLYQILTRARRRICLIIVNNELVLSRCLSLLNANQ